MASSLVDNSGTAVKCRKCRYQVLEEPPHRILYSSLDQDNQDASNTINICDDNLPQWIADSIEEGSWTKGKLLCPGCSLRLGGFDYVTRATEPVYLVRSKVDIRGPGARVEVVMPRPREVAELSDGGSESGSASQDTSGNEDSEDESEDSDESNTESDHADASRESSTSSSSESAGRRSGRQRMQRRRRKRKRDLMLKQKQREKKISQKDKLLELLEAEPELSEVNEDLLCPVCLDILHEPFRVDPCGHVFCEPCLRRLGQKNPMSCTCPLCRTKIFFCKHQATMSTEIRDSHQSLYVKRKKFERSTPVYQYPLPWQPGWRNLLRGRPLGGNNIARDNRLDWVRTILHQIPYYIPPVIIANIINIGIFAFMMGFIEIFPNLLAIVFGTSKNMSLILNTTLEASSENSGDPLPGMDDSVDPDLAGEMGELTGLDSGDAGEEAEPAAWEAWDVTLACTLLVTSLAVAGMGQILRHLEQTGWNRQTDFSLVLVLLVAPLALVLPLIVPWRNSEGSWIGALVEKVTSFFLYHMNYYTALLLAFTVWFVYHVDIDDDLLW